MSRPVNAVPPLPYPGRGTSTSELAAFDQDLTRALHAYLSELARRANEMLPKDGSEIADKVHIEGASLGDISLSSWLTDPFHIGTQTGLNIGIDANEIAARNNGATASIHINADGGRVRLHTSNPSEANTILELGGGKIEFPASQLASTNANTLDDYEEGTWTPTINFSGGSTGVTYSTQVGSYVKIGQLVYYQCRVILTSNGTSVGNLRIEGLPFTSASTSHFYVPGSAGYYQNFTGLSGSLKGYIETNSTYINMVQSTSTGISFVTDALTTDTMDIIFAGTYRASA